VCGSDTFVAENEAAHFDHVTRTSRPLLRHERQRTTAMGGSVFFAASRPRVTEALRASRFEWSAIVPGAHRFAFGQVANCHADAPPNSETLKITGRIKFIGTLRSVEFWLVPLLHQQARCSPNINVGDHQTATQTMPPPVSL